MNFVLALAYRRQREQAGRSNAADRDATSGLNGTTVLWELAERYHPEEAWLAESYVRGERTLDELASTAPRGGLAPSFQSASQTMVPVTMRAQLLCHGGREPIDRSTSCARALSATRSSNGASHQG